MHGLVRGLASGLCIFFLAPALSAGLYNTGEVFPLDTDLDFLANFRPTLLQLRNLPAPQVKLDYPLRNRYLVAQAADPRKLLTAEEKMNLSEVLIRRRKLGEAKAVLEPLAVQQRTNILIQSNLATLYHVMGLDQRAIDILRDQVLGQWPEHFGDLDEARRDYLLNIGWNEGPYGFYRKTETYFLKLLELRVREAAKFGKKTPESVDDLFTDIKGNPVRFVDESGQFSPGKIAKAERSKLPMDAVEIVRQLLVWLPDDARLYRLLGELHNARGQEKDLIAARTIFTDLGEEPFSFRSEEFKDRRNALQNMKFEPKNTLDDLDVKVKKEEQQRAVDWQTLGIGFGAGVIVAIFGMWQIRELRRRRAAH